MHKIAIIKCIVDIGAEVLRDCTDVKMKSKPYQTDNFKLFLGKTKHCLFHQLFKQKPICCECPSNGCCIKKTGHMNKKIFDKFYMYDKTVRCVHGHHGANGKTFSQTCICRFVEQTLVLKDLDLSDLNCLLRCLSLMSSSEEKLLKELMDIRGNICHAVDTKTFSQPELTNLWTTFMNAVCNLYPLDPKFLKMSIDLTKSSVLSDEKVLDLMEKVQQIITDCNPEIMDFKRKIDTLQNQQKDNNTILKKIESFLMGNITKKDNQTQTNISLYDSDKTFITDGTSSEKQGVKHLDCEANCPDLDEDKAIKRLSTETDLELKIESVEKHCLLLRLSSIPELFESKEMLYSAIMSLVQKISDAGDIDKSVDSNMDIKITFTSPLTDDERTTIMSMLGTFGTINEGYTAATTDREEGICDIDSNVMDYSDNSGNNERKKVLTKEDHVITTHMGTIATIT